MSRMQAGLQLKNAVYSKDLSVRAVHQQRWLQFPEEIRIHVKQNVSVQALDMFGSPAGCQFDFSSIHLHGWVFTKWSVGREYAGGI